MHLRRCGAVVEGVEDSGHIEAERVVRGDRLEGRWAEMGDGGVAQIVAVAFVGVGSVL